MSRQLDRDDIPCREGGQMHRQVRGQEHCGDCRVVIIRDGMFIRSARLDPNWSPVR